MVTNYWEFKSPTALRKAFRRHFKLSPRQLPHSYTFFRVINRFMSFGDVSPFKLQGPPRTIIIEEYIDTIKKSGPTLPFPRCQQQWTCLRVLCGRFWGKHWENIHINLKLFKVLPINTNCVEYNFAFGGVFEYKQKSFKKRLNRQFFIQH